MRACVRVCVCVRECVCVRAYACVRACVRTCVLYIFVLKVVGVFGGLAPVFRLVPHIPADHVPIPTPASWCRYWAGSVCSTGGDTGVTSGDTGVTSDDTGVTSGDTGVTSGDRCFRCSCYSCYSGARQKQKYDYLNEMHKTRN